MITKVLELMTCFCGDKLKHKPLNLYNNDTENTKADESNEELEKNLLLIKQIIDNNFPKQRNSHVNKLTLRLSSSIPRIDFNSVKLNVVYDSDTEVFKTSAGNFIFI